MVTLPQNTSSPHYRSGSDSTTKAASNPEKKKHEQSHINGTAKLNMRQTDGMALGEGDFNWDEKTQGLVLGACFYGYMANCFLGGRAAEYLGGRVVYGIGVVLPSFLTLFTSLCFSISKELFIVLRVLEGLGQALMYPALSSMLTAWVPPRERDTFMAVLLSGSMLGTMLAMLVGGWLCSCSGIFMFYLFSCLGVLWGVPWDIVAHDHPERHPRISKAELDYIIAHRTYVKRDKVAATTPVKYLVAGTTSTDFIFNNGTLEELLKTLWALIVLYAQRASPVFWNAAALLTN
ncbi:hypothetical protein Pmani_000909 [Petrolisthes manimaculis]|uniref:Major facilitator superfamily (MFS) profile domain-containing protein n=1 Tax=Petrolisthes manimaculis TaxID=1843537 RepID=A0AAE1USJ5_9EUCA|nr:hypothetical protein Pmani_000909 [Petrolisthes manimaculis]